jgi:hypothetical protein
MHTRQSCSDLFITSHNLTYKIAQIIIIIAISIIIIILLTSNIVSGDGF